MSESDLARVLLFILRVEDRKDKERSCIGSPKDTPNDLFYILLPPSFSPRKSGREFCKIHCELLEGYNTDWFLDDLLKATNDHGEGVDVIELLLEVHPRSDKLKFYTKVNDKTTVCDIFTSSDFIVESIDQSEFQNRSFPWPGDPIVFQVFSHAIYVMFFCRKSTLLQQLLELGVDMNAIECHPEGWTLLEKAARIDRVNAVNLLVQHGADVNARGFCGRTALYDAAEAGHRDAVAALIAAGASADTRDKFGMSALTAACLNDRLQSREVVTLLLENNADRKDLIQFIANSRFVNDKKQQNLGRFVQIFCEFGARGDTKGASGRTALHEAAERGFREVIEILIQNSNDVNVLASPGNRTPLAEAIVSAPYWDKNVLDIVKLLLEKGADPNVGAPIVSAMNGSGKKELVKLLCHFGARGDMKDESGRTALHEAAKNGDHELLEMLIRNSDDIDVVSSDENVTPLMDAILGKRPNAVVKLLLENGADPKKETLVIAAAKLGQVDTVTQLCELGARGDIMDVSGRSALHEAAKLRDPELLRILIKHSNDLNVCPGHPGWGLTPLKEAISGGRSKSTPIVVKLLLENGADPKKRDFLESAIKSKQVEVVKLLCEFGARVEQLDSSEWRRLWGKENPIGDDLMHILVVYNFDVEIFNSLWIPTYVDMDILKTLSKYGDCRVLSNGLEYIHLIQGWLIQAGCRPRVYSYEKEILTYILEYNAKYLRPRVINSALQRDLMGASTARGTEVRDIFFEILLKINLIDFETSHPVQHFLKNIPTLFLPDFYSSRLRDWLRNYIERDGAKLVKDCLAELLVLKDTLIGDSPWTLYDVLTKDVHYLATLAKNDEFAKPLNCSLRFPNYGRIIEYQHQKSCHRRNRLDRALGVSERAFGNLPDEVAEVILEKLNTRDLLIFEAACSPSACV